MATIGITATLLVALFVATGVLIVHDQRRIQKARESDLSDVDEAMALSLLPPRCDLRDQLRL
jgi:hypothetical protein